MGTSTVGAPASSGRHAGSGGAVSGSGAMREGTPVGGWGRSVVAGLVSVVFGAGVGEIVAAFFAAQASPFAAIGSTAIDLAPTWAKDLAIAWFGTADKAALLVGIAVVLLAVGAVAGLLERRMPFLGRGVVALLGVVGVLAASMRENSHQLFWLPSLVAGVLAVIALGMLIPRSGTGAGEGMSRRAFVIRGAIFAAAGVIGAAVATTVQAGGQAVQALREKIQLPSGSNTVGIPAGAELDIDGLAKVVTPNAEFYRIDTALVVPEIDPADWTLRIHGLVEREVTISWDELLALPLQESAVTLSCVSNTVGGSLVGNAIWLGHPIRELLAEAGPLPEADMVLSHSHDGFTAGTPLKVLTDERDALLAVGMNGEPLPVEHGFPVRMVVPGLYGYVSATKWVVELEVTRFDTARAYWTDRGWSEQGPIKVQSRIDVPRSGEVAAGERMIAGVAWQPHTGISGVEVQVDDGQWQQAELATAISGDTWVQWALPWAAEPGEHRIRCRATSAAGETQTSDLAPPAPDGATGRHRIDVTVV